MTDKIPFMLNLIGGIITLLTGAILVFGAALVFAAAFPAMFMITESLLIFMAGWAVWNIIIGIVLIYYGVRIENSSVAETKRMSRITLVVSILGLVTLVGFFIGPIVSLVGSLIGMTTKVPPQRGRKRQAE